MKKAAPAVRSGLFNSAYECFNFSLAAYYIARVARRLRRVSRRAAKPVRTGATVDVRRRTAGAATNSVPFNMVVMSILIFKSARPNVTAFLVGATYARIENREVPIRDMSYAKMLWLF